MLAASTPSPRCCPQPTALSPTALPADALYDFGQDDELAWRQAGDSWEAPAVPEGEEAEGGEGAIYSLNEIAAAIKAAER